MQAAFNTEHGIEPTTVTKNVADILNRLRSGERLEAERSPGVEVAASDLAREMARVEEAMLQAAAELRFEEAAVLRDALHALHRQSLEGSDDLVAAE
ncbi:MAG: UvrB/UvrC motif-containing protein, partial [Acidimicrobiales bacterium]